MRFLPQLFENNRAWAARMQERDSRFFQQLSSVHDPDHLWIGCSDSRVPANEIVGLDPGELFVHRNVANVAAEDDTNCLAVLQYGIDSLKVEHVIVCGHYGCGGVQAALGPAVPQPLEGWLRHVRQVAREHAAELEELEGDARWRRLCELNVRAQVRAVCRLPTVTAAWARGQALFIHGWIFDLETGLLRDMGLSTDRPPDWNAGT